MSGTDLDPFADWLAGAPDGQLSDRALSEIDRLKEPFFAVVQRFEEWRKASKVPAPARKPAG